MNFQGFKATVPPRIFIQTRIRLGQKSQFNNKNYFSWKCQATAPPCGHLPKELIAVCSPASWPLPCLPRRSLHLLTQHGRGGEGRRELSLYTPRWTAASGEAGSATLPGAL